jgi:hypothetical protein
MYARTSYANSNPKPKAIEVSSRGIFAVPKQDFLGSFRFLQGDNESSAFVGLLCQP